MAWRGHCALAGAAYYREPGWKSGSVTVLVVVVVVVVVVATSGPLLLLMKHEHVEQCAWTAPRYAAQYLAVEQRSLWKKQPHRRVAVAVVVTLVTVAAVGAVARSWNCYWNSGRWRVRMALACCSLRLTRRKRRKRRTMSCSWRKLLRRREQVQRRRKKKRRRRRQSSNRASVQRKKKPPVHRLARRRGRMTRGPRGSTPSHLCHHELKSPWDTRSGSVLVVVVAVAVVVGWCRTPARHRSGASNRRYWWHRVVVVVVVAAVALLDTIR